jgi:hypothetical protein
METKNKPKLKRVFADVAEEIHTTIKTSATIRGISMRAWILRAIMEQIKKEKTFE